MFDELVESTKKKKTNKVWSVWFSAGVEALVLIILILIPLIYTRALPPLLSTSFLAAPPPPPPPPPPAAVVKVKPQPKFEQKMVTPTVVPKKIAMIHQEAPPPDVGVSGGVPGGVPGGSSAGVLGGIIGGAPGGLPAPPPKPSAPLRIGGNVMQGRILRQVTPQYPQIARIAHVSGTVVLHAIIDENGDITSLTYVSGPALLKESALQAVREWKYVPYKLNGQPVKVDTTISVIFNLGE